MWIQEINSIFTANSESETTDLGREFGSDNCFSVSSFLTFNLVLATTVINVVSNLNSTNNNNNNDNNLNANVNGRRRREVEYHHENPFVVAGVKKVLLMQEKNIKYKSYYYQ